jgi:hypothetical protein
MEDTYLVGRRRSASSPARCRTSTPRTGTGEAAAKLGYSGLVAPLTFTSAPAMACNQRMFEQIVVGYDMYLQTEEVFEQHRPIVEGDELTIDVELTAVRRIAAAT